MTGKTEANHYDLLAAGNYDYTFQDGTHTLTIDRHDLNLNITAERQYGDISNQQYVSDYKSDAKPSGTTLSYATGVTSDTNGLQNGETIDFTKSTVALSDNFAQADAGTYTHKWYNDDTNQSADYSIGNKGITSITLKAGDGSAFDSKNYNIHYTTTYTIDKADLYYTYDGERNYGADNAAAAHTYTIVGKDKDSTAESVRGYLKSWDSGVLAGGNVLNNDLLKVTNTNGNGDGKAYTMTGVAIQDADTASKDSTAAANVTAPETSKSIGKDSATPMSLSIRMARSSRIRSLPSAPSLPARTRRAHWPRTTTSSGNRVAIPISWTKPIPQPIQPAPLMEMAHCRRRRTRPTRLP